MQSSTFALLCALHWADVPHLKCTTVHSGIRERVCCLVATNEPLVVFKEQFCDMLHTLRSLIGPK
jgi:hypothetical protein